MIHPFRKTLAFTVIGFVGYATFNTTAQAELIAYDGFDYPAGTSLTGQTGPLGFSAPYTAAASGSTVSSPGFGYTDLPVTGGKVALTGSTNSGTFGMLTNSPETAGTTIYMSYLMQLTADAGYAGVSLFDGTTETLFTGNRNSGANVFGIEAKVGTSASSTASSASLSLVVYRIDFTATGAKIRLYVNPTSGVEPATADAEVDRTSPLTYDRIRIQSSGTTGFVDELRIGETFADVAPVTSGIINQTITVLGSSVASGTGASPSTLGWAARMKTLLETTGPIDPESNVVFQVANASVGGDNTSLVLNRFQNDVINAHPDSDVVIISLSLANQGLVNASNPQAVFDSFKSGITQIINLCRAQGYYPVISVCYPQNDYGPVEYSYVKRMNLLLNSWDLPSINFLGAIDDGSGHWASGFFADAGHPNAQGHGELFYSVVPSLFDAIARGKTTIPEWQGTHGYLRLQRDEAEDSPIRFAPANTMHSFNLSFRIRTTDVGSIAAVGAAASRATLEIREGSLVYIRGGGQETSIPVTINDGRWHDIALSQRYATSRTLLYVDGVLKGTISDRYTPDLFVVGGADLEGRAAAPLQADYQDVAVYRSAWTQDEAMAQSKGALQQASMEICAPLADNAPMVGAEFENRAQSYSKLTLESSGATSMAAATTPDNLIGNSFTPGSVSLSWTDNGGEGEFTIERRPTEGTNPWVVAGTVPTGSSSYEDSGLTSGLSYDYRISNQEGTLQSDYSNVVSLAPGGQSAISYADWIGGFFTKSTETFLIDFNTNANPNYGGVKWNTVNSLSSTTPYNLTDTNNRTAAGVKLTLTDGFDQFRSDNGSPIAGYAADAQITQFALRDDNPLTGAMSFTGLTPGVGYDFVFLARRGSLVGGFDYSGTYTFTGEGAPVVVEAFGASNTSLTTVPTVIADSTGKITLKISAGPGTGTDFPVINFIQMTKSGVDQAYLDNIDPNADPDNDGLINLEEYARQLNPTTANPEKLRLDSYARDESGPSFGFNIMKDRRAIDARYVAERSVDLDVWEEDTTAVETVINRSGNTETVSFRSPAAGEKMFYRVRIRMAVPE